MCLSGVKQYPMRVKCATLSWHTLVSAFEDKTDLVKTENWRWLKKNKLLKKLDKFMTQNYLLILMIVHALGA